MARNLSLRKISFKNEALITINRFVSFISLITIKFSKTYILYHFAIFLILVYHFFLLNSSAHLLTRSIFIIIFKRIRSIFFFSDFLQSDEFTSIRTLKCQKCHDVFDLIRVSFNTTHSIIDVNFFIFIKNEQLYRSTVFVILIFSA